MKKSFFLLIMSIMFISTFCQEGKCDSIEIILNNTIEQKKNDSLLLEIKYLNDIISYKKTAITQQERNLLNSLMPPKHFASF